MTEYIDLLDSDDFPYIATLFSDYLSGVSFSLPGRNEPKFPFAQILLATFAYAVKETASDIHLEYHPNWGYKINVATMRKGMVHVNTEHLSTKDRDAQQFKEMLFTRCGFTVGSQEYTHLSARLLINFPTKWALNDCKLPVKKQRIHRPTYNLTLRVAFIRIADNGFSFTLRLIDDNNTRTLDEMGLPYSITYELRRLCQLKSGLIIFAGPTGSGKSSTQFACLQEANDGRRKIVTIEDPVEFMLEGPAPIVPIDITGDLSAKVALTTSLRMAAQILLIGEIRDSAMLQIALSAATTGHLVFATVHADSAPAAIDRLFKLLPENNREAELGMLSSALRSIVCQRLIPVRTPSTSREIPDLVKYQWFEKNSGVKLKRFFAASDEVIGRKVMAEMILVDYEMQLAIESFDAEKIFEAACKQYQFETLLQQGLRYVEEGMVSLEDAHRLLGGQPKANRFKTLRLKLSEEYNLPLGQIDKLITQYYMLLSQNTETNIDHLCKEYLSIMNPDKYLKKTPFEHEA